MCRKGGGMKLTLKELQKSMQEQIDKMNTQLQKSKREEYELHERADSHLLNMDAFRKETAFNFREMRAEFRTEMDALRAEFRSEMDALRTEFRSEIDVLKADVTAVKADLAVVKADLADLRAELREWRHETRATFTAIMRYIEIFEANHEGRIAALEAKNPH